MTNGMMAWSQVVEEQLNTITNKLACHDALLSKLDSLYTMFQQNSKMVQQHSENFKML